MNDDIDDTYEFSIAKNFSMYPGGIKKEDSDASGERLKEILMLRLSNYPKVRVDLDGTNGYSSSFLKEAFIGLPKKRVELISKEDPSLIDEIREYMDMDDTLENEFKMILMKYPLYRYPPMWGDLALALARRVDRIERSNG